MTADFQRLQQVYEDHRSRGLRIGRGRLSALTGCTMHEAERFLREAKKSPLKPDSNTPPEPLRHTDTPKIPKPFKADPVQSQLKQRIVVISDLHIPFEDTYLVQKILSWMETQTLSHVVINGDLMDCASISKYLGHNQPSLSEEIQRTNVFLDQLTAAARKRNPYAQITLIEGNHEHRLIRTLEANANQLIDLELDGEPVVSFQHLLKLRERRIKHLTYMQCLEVLPGLFIEHGHRVSKHSSYTVANVMRDVGGSLIIGHVHRVGAFFKTDRLGFHRGYELGCLCLEPEYMPEKSANWQRGFGIIDVVGDQWWYSPVISLNRTFLIDGQII